MNIINNKYNIDSIIGEGKFGKIFKGKNITNGELVAIKTEYQETPYKLLKNEASILNYLYSNGCRNIPIVYWYGLKDNILYIIMPLYKCSLYDFVKQQNMNDLIIKSIMVQCIQLIKSIHKLFIIHRDIKPHNFMINDGKLYLIDFGFSTFFVNDKKEHISIKTTQDLLGSPKYMSIHVLNNLLPSRRDDLISLGYIYAFILNVFIGASLNEKNIILLEETFKASHPKLFYFLKSGYEIEYHEPPDYSFFIELVS